MIRALLRGLAGAVTKTLSTVRETRGWLRIFESFAGAWQANVTIDRNLVLTQSTVFAVLTLIASDIAKLPLRLIGLNDGIWQEITNPAWSPVLRRPNGFQNRIQFIESWMLSKLSRGNTYVLKERDNRNVVTALYILDPDRVTPLVSDDGSVFYQLQSDNLAGVTQAVVVPASEIIHDRINCLFHPLVGVPPLYACALAAQKALNIDTSASSFFGNRSQPGGVLTAPGAISDETAARLKESWSTNFSGENAGKVAVLGDGLKFEQMAQTADESQLIEQLKWSGETICSVMHVPPYKVGLGALPAYNNIQALNVEYYSQGLQIHIESLELCLDEGLALPSDIGVECDVENLLRMDSVTQMEVLKNGAGIMKLDEQRRKLSLPKVKGGDTVYLQQQNYSVAALAKRDAQDDPFATSRLTSPPPTAKPAQELAPVNDNTAEQASRALAALAKGLME